MPSLPLIVTSVLLPSLALYFCLTYTVPLKFSFSFNSSLGPLLFPLGELTDLLHLQSSM